MHTFSLFSSLNSKFIYLKFDLYMTNTPRQNPAVTSQPAKVFVFVAQALEAETLQGQTATRVVEATKTLLAAASLNPAQLLAQLSPETQAIVHAWFA